MLVLCCRGARAARQIAGGTPASVGLLIQKARKIFLADIECRVLIALLTIDANGDYRLRIGSGFMRVSSSVTF
jgi:hypothetical protein